MDIFLIFVLIILVIIFYSTHNSKFSQLYNQIGKLQKQVEEALRQQEAIVQKQQEAIIRPIEEEIIPEKKVEPPVIIEEEKIAEEKEIPPVIIEEREKEPVMLDTPAIENSQLNRNPPPVVVPQLSWWDKFKERNPDLEKFIGENLISKIGVAILVLGIAFFVKYAIDQNWINEAARVGIGILCGSIVMVFAHKLRLKFKPFSSVLVAGAIAIFYFTIGIGFHEYHLFSQTAAFAIMLVITAFSVFISVAYDRVELAALSIVGGFAVPFMVSTGQGNYKVLFTYILILDIGMLVLAYLKKWNLINILAYVFTIFLYSAWLSARVMYQIAPPYKGAFFFGLIFYMVFVLMNVINNVKERKQFTYIELIILISNTFVFYITGMLILKEWHPEYKGIYTIALGSFNLILGLILYKYFKADKKLVYLLVGLTLTFATLAAPVQLKGNYITLFWGAEVALLIWLSLRSQLKAFRLASMIVGGLMFFSLMMDYFNIYIDHSNEFIKPLLNKGFITGITSSIFLFAGAFFLTKKEGVENPELNQNTDVYANILKIMGCFFAYLTGFFEIHHQSSYYIYSGSSVVSISCFYHVIFTSVLAIIMLKKYTLVNNIISFVMLGISLVYFTFVFAIAPYHELTERCRGEHSGYFGYLTHFAALAFISLHILATIKTAVKRNNFIISAKTVFLWLFGTFIIIIVSNEVILNIMVLKLNSFIRPNEYDIVRTIYDYMHEQVVKIALPITWAVIAFTFLSIGIKQQLKSLRIMALALLALTLLKLFIYDINDVSEAGKIIAFIILGVVLLVMSFMYQKIKALILSEENITINNPADEETTN
jgi:hypothetical protein